MPDSAEINVCLRPYDPETDRSFLMKTWLLSYRSMKTRISPLVYYAAQQCVVEKIIQAPTSRAVICTDRDDPNFIFGFAVGDALRTLDPKEPLLVHYVFTKLSYRGSGIAQFMLRGLGWEAGRSIHATHMTRPARTLAPRYLILENDYPLKGANNGRLTSYCESKISYSHNVPVGGQDPGTADDEREECAS